MQGEETDTYANTLQIEDLLQKSLSNYTRCFPYRQQIDRGRQVVLVGPVDGVVGAAGVVAKGSLDSMHYRVWHQHYC